MSYSDRLRRSLTWLAHCFKAVFRDYHRQLLPLFGNILKHDDLVIDVGAHAGQFSRIFSRFVPHGLVLAVEPGRYALAILYVVRFLHRMWNVNIIAKGVGRQAGGAILQTPLKHSGVAKFGLSHIGSNGADTDNIPAMTETVSITTIDTLVDLYGSGRKFALLKADIEGHEYEMLCGAIHAIENSRPAVFLEVSRDRNNIMDFLWQREYAIFKLLNYGGKKVEHLRLAEIPFQSESDAHDILAIHKSNHDILQKIRHEFC